ncbi:MAG TPA: DUF2845 domain-containing protein [Polyangiaceae bacterium]|nr:DUF2845 domain-containing protein [Polyangiaceae bacterium]
MTHRRVSGVFLGIAAAAAFAFASVPAHADGLRCGDKLASTGSSLYEVRATCGEPDDAQHSIETRTIEHRVLAPCPGASERHLCETVVLQTIEIAVDRWTYDFGSNRFIEFAHFEQGALVTVTNGTYGHKDPS